jgi:hypothetical protein
MGVPCVMEPVNDSRPWTVGRINPSVLGICSCTGKEFVDGDEIESGVPCIIEPAGGREELGAGGVDLGG